MATTTVATPVPHSSPSNVVLHVDSGGKVGVVGCAFDGDSLPTLRVLVNPDEMNARKGVRL